MSDKKIIKVDSTFGPIDIEDNFYTRIEKVNTHNKTYNEKKDRTLKKQKSFNEYFNESIKKIK